MDTDVRLLAIRAKNYRLFPQDGVEFIFPAEKSCTLIGPSGFGKTNLISTINDLLFYHLKDVKPKKTVIGRSIVRFVILFVEQSNSDGRNGLW
jgi:ABC-type cobalamin/Fe3+-siderophores transport system ATPase subunit